MLAQAPTTSLPPWPGFEFASPCVVPNARGFTSGRRNLARAVLTAREIPRSLVATRGFGTTPPRHTSLKAGSESGRPPTRLPRFGGAAVETQFFRDRLHGFDAEGDVLIEIDAPRGRAVDDVVAIHLAGEGFVFHPLAH